MPKTFDAIYENGVLRPFVPLDLRHAERVLLSISDMDASLSLFLDAGEWDSEYDAAKRDQISPQEVRAALFSVQGSLTYAIVALREDRTY